MTLGFSAPWTLDLRRPALSTAGFPLSPRPPVPGASRQGHSEMTMTADSPFGFVFRRATPAIRLEFGHAAYDSTSQIYRAADGTPMFVKMIDGQPMPAPLSAAGSYGDVDTATQTTYYTVSDTHYYETGNDGQLTWDSWSEYDPHPDSDMDQ